MNRHTTDDARFLELLERWLTGAFDRTDERELYALTEADAFRREAWEGFSALPETEHEAYMARIRKRLMAQKPARRIPLGAWMSAAAALVFVAAAIYFWPKPDSEEPAPVAQTTETTTPPPPDIAATSDVADPPAASRPAAPVETPTALLRRSEQSGPTPSQSGSDDFAAMDADKAEEKISGDAPVIARETDAALSERMRQTQPAQPQGIASGAPAANSASKKSSDTESAKPAAPVSTVPMKKKADSVSDSDLPKAVLPASAAEPNGGWEIFHDYLRRHARLPEAARNNNVSGSVRLQFIVGPDGKPVNVQFLRKLGYGCEEEAERLVRLFDWAPSGAAPVVVDVPFRR